MTTLRITIDDSLPLSELKTVLSLIRGVKKVEIAESFKNVEKKEYEQLKTAFFNGSKSSMANQINRYI